MMNFAGSDARAVARLNGETNMNDIPADAVRGDVEDEGGAITLLDFCDRYKLSRSTFYEMRKRGLGPREIHIGRRVLITRRAIREWEETMADRWATEQLLADGRKRSGMRKG